MEPIEVTIAVDTIEVRERGDEPAFDNPQPYLWLFFFKRDRNGLFVRPTRGRSGSHGNVSPDLVAPTTVPVAEALGTFNTALWPLDPGGNDLRSVVGVFGALLERDSTPDQSIIDFYFAAFRDVSSVLSDWTPPAPLPEVELRNKIGRSFQLAIDTTILPDRDDLIQIFIHTETYSSLASTFWSEIRRPFDSTLHGRWTLSTRIAVRPLVGLGNSALFESRKGLDTALDAALIRRKYLESPPAYLPDTTTRIVMDALHLIETKAPTERGDVGFHAGDLVTNFRDDSLITTAFPDGGWESGLPFTWVDEQGRSRSAADQNFQIPPSTEFNEAFRWPCWVESRRDFVHGIAVKGVEAGAKVYYFYGGWGQRYPWGLVTGVRDAAMRSTLGIWVPYQTPSPISGADDCRGAPALARCVGPVANSLIVLVPSRRGGIDVYTSPDPAANQNGLAFIGDLGFDGSGLFRRRDGGGLVRPTLAGEIYGSNWPPDPPRLSWSRGPHFGSNVVDAVRVLQSDFDAIEVLASEQTSAGRKLVTYILDGLDPTQDGWRRLDELPGSEVVTGIPGFMQSNYGRAFTNGHGNFEVIAPGHGNQLWFWWCNSNLGRIWNGPFAIGWDDFMSPIKAVHLIQLHRRGNQSPQNDFLMVLETGVAERGPARYGAGQMYWSRRANDPEPGPWSFPAPIRGWNRSDL